MEINSFFLLVCKVSKPKVLGWQTVLKEVILGTGMFEACAANHNVIHLSFWPATETCMFLTFIFFKRASLSLLQTKPVPKVQPVKQRNWVQFHSSNIYKNCSFYDVYSRSKRVTKLCAAECRFSSHRASTIGQNYF